MKLLHANHHTRGEQWYSRFLCAVIASPVVVLLVMLAAECGGSY